MQDSKGKGWSSQIVRESESDSITVERADAVDTSSPESDGWQQYRRWISKAPAPRGRRTGVDPSIYTWKGYRSWADQVKRNWSDS